MLGLILLHLYSVKIRSIRNVLFLLAVSETYKCKSTCIDDCSSHFNVTRFLNRIQMNSSLKLLVSVLYLTVLLLAPSVVQIIVAEEASASAFMFVIFGAVSSGADGCSSLCIHKAVSIQFVSSPSPEVCSCFCKPVSDVTVGERWVCCQNQCCSSCNVRTSHRCPT